MVRVTADIMHHRKRAVKGHHLQRSITSQRQLFTYRKKKCFKMLPSKALFMTENADQIFGPFMKTTENKGAYRLISQIIRLEI